MPEENDMVKTMWSFQQTDEGYVVLHLLTGPNSLTPVLVFGSPESFLNFREDVERAAETFIPASVRQAIKVLEDNPWGNKPPPQKPEQLRLV